MVFSGVFSNPKIQRRQYSSCPASSKSNLKSPREYQGLHDSDLCRHGNITAVEYLFQYPRLGHWFSNFAELQSPKMRNKSGAQVKAGALWLPPSEDRPAASRSRPPAPRAMANSGLQLLGFALALLGVVANLTATILPQWRVSSFADGNIITAQSYQVGLWMECVWQSTGQLQCKVYDSMLSLTAAMQATRALMVVSIVLGVIAVGIATMGMKCTHCGGDNKVTKARIAMTGGFVFLVGGLASLVACSWMAHQIIRDFYDPLSPINKRYEMGASVYLGWAGAALMLLGGGLLACSCPGDEAYKGRQYPQAKPISKPPSSREYV